MEQKLNEQWVEIIDGERHLYKAVAGECFRCCHTTEKDGCSRDFGKCPTGAINLIVKDLGILNEDGCLPAPWGGYPKIVRVGREGFCTYKVRFYLKHGIAYGFTLIEVTGNTRQDAINAWNRRA